MESKDSEDSTHRKIDVDDSLPEIERAYYMSENMINYRDREFDYNTVSDNDTDYDEHLLMMAFNNKDNDQILEFVDNQKDWKFIQISEDKETLLHIGVFSNNFDIWKSLLNRKAIVDAKNKEGQTPLHSAVLQKGLSKFVELLIKHNADPTIKDKSGNTPLHYNTCVTCLSII